MAEAEGMWGLDNIFFETVRSYAILYEIASTAANGGKPKKLIGRTLAAVNLLPFSPYLDDKGYELFPSPMVELIRERSIDTLATELVEWVYGIGERPAWVTGMGDGVAR